MNDVRERRAGDMLLVLREAGLLRERRANWGKEPEGVAEAEGVEKLSLY